MTSVTLADLEDSFLQADKAGDKETASILADAIRAARTSSPKAKIDVENDAINRGARAAIADKPFGYDAATELGRTARYGLEGVTSFPETIIGAPLTMGVNALNAATQKVTGRPMPQYSMPSIGGAVADAIGLPNTTNPTERVVADITRSLASVGGLAGLATKIGEKATSSLVKGITDMLSQNVGTQAVASAASSLGSGTARESGVGPAGQMAAGLVAGVTPALLRPVGAAIADKFGDAGATIGASMGNKSSIERLAKDAIQNEKISGDAVNARKVMNALGNATEYVPGAKTSVAEAITEGNAGNNGMFGGALLKLQKDLTGAQGSEDILTGAARTRQNVLDNYRTQIEQRTSPMRDAVYQAVTQNGGVPVKNVINNIDGMLSMPGIRASDIAQKALSNIKDQIEQLPNAGNKVNVEDLYMIRKQIGNVIKTSQGETKNFDKRLSVSLERSVQKSIDNAIERAGGTGWKNYLQIYSQGMQNIDSIKDRLKETKLLTSPIKGNNAADLVGGELPRLPNLLSRPAMATNFLLKMLSTDANTPVARSVATALADKNEFIKLMSKQPSDPARVLLERAIRQASIAELNNASQEQ
jgi:hypothetical protein